MTSKERITNAMRNQEVDYLPCTMGFSPNLTVPGYDMVKTSERHRLVLDMGLDLVPFTGAGYTMHPDVKIESWRENVNDCEFPILWQRWKTPEGDLTQAVKLSDENADWEQIHWGDISASNTYKSLITTAEDVNLLHYVYAPCSDDRVKLLVQSVEEHFSFVQAEQLATQCCYGQGLAVAMFMMGAENLLYFSIDYPEAFKKLAEVIHNTEMKRIEHGRMFNVDILKRFGGYEMTNFFSPETFRDVLAPLLRKEVAKAHELDMLIYYRVVTGMEPILDDIADIGFDCIEGGEPCLSKCSLEQWYAAFAGKACSWTGISTPGMLGMGTPESVRENVRHAVDVFGKRSFILEAINGIHNAFPWENTLAAVDEWKKVR